MTKTRGIAAETVNRSSNRVFGLVFAALFAIVALAPLLRGRSARIWAVGCAGGFVLAALAAPKVLSPLNRMWTALGAALHKVTNPLILGVFFYLLFTPLAWILRAVGKEFLRLRWAPEADSYWIPRDPPGPEPRSMTQQF